MRGLLNASSIRRFGGLGATLWTGLILAAAPRGAAGAFDAVLPVESSKKVFILPIRAEISPPLTYLVRRGVKEAMDAKADLLVLDMETPGGRVDVTKDIIGILEKFPNRTATYVNREAYSAGAFIAVATQQIYMAPQSVIGAAAPIMLSPGGGGVQALPETVEVKMTSAIAARVRASAAKNGHNTEVVEAMINKNKELTIDGVVLNKQGQLLTLTNLEAEKEYGNPPKPLLSAGTFESIDALLDRLGFGQATRHRIEPTGAEQVGTWINSISWLLLIIGVAGVYIEFKTPGFGLPGIVGIIAFTLYFFGGYVAGLSGVEWVVVFVLGLALIIVEFFVLPGTIVPGLLGTALMIAALVMALVDIYPGMPRVPTMPQLELPIRQLTIALVGSVVVILILSRLLPKTSLYRSIVSSSASGMQTEVVHQEQRKDQMGRTGVAVSHLRPGGKAQFGDQILDVVSQGMRIEKGSPVKIIGFSGGEAVVETV